MEARSAAGSESLLKGLKEKFEAPEDSHHPAGITHSIPDCTSGEERLTENVPGNQRSSLKAIQPNVVSKTAKKFETASEDGSPGTERTETRSGEVETKPRDLLCEPRNKGIAKGGRSPMSEKPKVLPPKPKVDLSAKLVPNQRSDREGAIEEEEDDDYDDVEGIDLKKYSELVTSPKKLGKPANLRSPEGRKSLEDDTCVGKIRCEVTGSENGTTGIPNSKPSVKLKSSEILDKAKHGSSTKKTPPPKPVRPTPKKPVPDNCESKVDSITNGKPSPSQLRRLEREGGYTKVIPKDLRKKGTVSPSGLSTKNTYDGVIFLPTNDEADGSGKKNAGDKPCPPPKPVRTFAHDDYLRHKAEKKARRSGSPSLHRKVKHLEKGSKTSDSLVGKPKLLPKQISAPVEPLYAEVPDAGYSEVNAASENKSAVMEEIQFQTGKKAEDRSNTYETVDVSNKNVKDDKEKVKLNKGKHTLTRRPTDKPPAPPRPPQPSAEAKSRLSSGSDCEQMGHGAHGAPPCSPGLSRWDDPVVRLSKRTKKLPEDAILKERKVSNPNYDRHHDIIVIKKNTNQKKAGLKRCKSDEYIYAEPVELGGGASQSRSKAATVHTEPIYQDPLDVIQPRKPRVTKQGVHLDEYGYAIPDAGRHTLGRQPVREKVSKAYAILRHRFSPTEAANDDPALESVEEDDDGDSQVDMEEHRRRLEYIYSIKEKHYSSLQRCNSQRTYPQLFEYSLVVGMTKVEDTNNYKAQILFRFPEKVLGELNTIAQFCFPDASAWRPVTHYTSETYSFVLTDSDGSRKYGYCRRMLPPGTNNRLPEVVCIVSPLSAFTFYEELLLFLEKLRADSMEHVEMMLKSTHVRPIPSPGREVYFLSPASTRDRAERLTLRRSEDCRMERVSFKTLMGRLSTDMLLKVFASLLLERRIILTGQHLSTLSSCVHALVSLLYPFRWQHVYISVLPDCMIDVLACPTPYMVGLLASDIPRLADLPMEEVLIVDLDNNQLLQSQGDEGDIIPRKLQKALTIALKEDSDSTMSQNVMVSEAFLRLFVEVTSHYTEYVCTQQDGKKVFQKELFCKAVSSKSIRMFLEWFTETQMFEVFITDHMEAPGPLTGIYETRLEEYREEMAEMSHSLKANVKELGRKMINLILESGGKLKKAIRGTANNVYI